MHNKKTSTFYYFLVNFNEGRSVARALPRFIEDFLGVDPNFCCSNQFATEAKHGTWDNERHVYTTVNEKAEKDKLGDLTTVILATNKQFISIDHHRAMATANDSVFLMNHVLQRMIKPHLQQQMKMELMNCQM